jgi:hypothetical protein
MVQQKSQVEQQVLQHLQPQNKQKDAQEPIRQRLTGTQYTAKQPAEDNDAEVKNI